MASNVLVNCAVVDYFSIQLSTVLISQGSLYAKDVDIPDPIWLSFKLQGGGGGGTPKFGVEIGGVV